MTRPLLLGAHNPLSADPRLALWPDPPGCAGWRLWKFSGLPLERWLAGFDRMNVVDSTEWDDPRPGRLADVRQCMQDRVTLVLGHQARAALALPPVEWLLPNELPNTRGWWGEGEWRLLPHPSGRSHVYNDDAIRTAVGVLLRELAAPKGVQR